MTHSHTKNNPVDNQNGSVLVIAIFCLLVLSILGIFALNTSDSEMDIAANQQKWEKSFNISEGATSKEGYGVGYAGVLDVLSNTQISPWYTITDPGQENVPLYPDTLANYDPSTDGDMPVSGTFPNDFKPDDPHYWPRQNLISDTSDDTHDYAYLVTYLYSDNPPKGNSAEDLSAYKFKINARNTVIIEVGGTKIGVKSTF